jgi:serine/threonine-protein kinase HipA
VSNVEVHIDWQRKLIRLGTMRRIPRAGRETVSFEYSQEWADSKENFPIDPALPIGPGVFYPPNGKEIFGTIGDSAPDNWGRSLMRRRERRQAEVEDRRPKTLQETDYLLGVSDQTRLGALRFRREGEEEFQAPLTSGVPGTIELGRLLNASQRIINGEETDEDLLLIFAPGSSLGGARPKASILDQHSALSIAKFPKDDDDYSIERWEAIAFELAQRSGIRTAAHQVQHVGRKPIFISKRFDRDGDIRIPFMSAMAMTQHADREEASYLELVDTISENGANPKDDRRELFRRVAFSILVSNTDDHLRNHGFLWMGNDGWTLSPAYDINPTPEDKKPRILTTLIDYHDGTCSIELLRSVAEQYSIKLSDADEIINDVARVTSQWKDVASEYDAPNSEVRQMSTAFEHHDLDIALGLN